LIFTVIFFSVTFNSPANYSSAARFYNILRSGDPDPNLFPPVVVPASDTSKPGLRLKKTPGITDTIPRDSSLFRYRDSVIKLRDSVLKLRDAVLKLKDSARLDSLDLILSTIPDSLRNPVDTPDYRISKDTMAAAIDYKAGDSVVMDIPSKKITLYNKANTQYQDANLTAYKIEYDQIKNIVTATPTKDTAGNVIGLPKMVQADNTMTSDTIVYSVKSQKGVTKNTYTVAGSDMYLHAQNMKKVSPDVYYGYRGIFTSCNLDTPHFAFVTNKMKLINKKFAITGPVHPEFEGVPIPIYIPFGFFPISMGRHSGLLPPQFTANDQAGVGLEGLGYYKVINEYFDVTVRTNLYSYGGWNLYVTPTYRVRYRYSGQLNFALQNTKLLTTTEGSKDEYTTGKTWSLNWSHTMDSKARPGTNFSANVNIMSTKYNSYIPNNPTANYNNQLGSSITYSKTWNGKYNLTVGATHSQNNLTRLIQISAPNLTFSAPTIYPLQKKDFVGEAKWYEKLGIGLTTNLSGGATFYDSLATFKKVIDTFQWGAQNSIPISLALPLKGPVQVTPGLSFSNRVFSRKLFRQYDTAKGKVDTLGIEKGIWTMEDIAFSLSLSTAIFGTFQKFGKNSSLMGIRHVIRPTISLSYKPDLASHAYYNLPVPNADSTNKIPLYTQRVSYFDGATYGPFGEGVFGGISFGLDNHFEIKTRSKKDTTESGIKKIPIIDGIGFNGSYNYLADSFKLSNIAFYFRSTLFQKINITGGANLDPYITDSLGHRKNVLAWQQPGKGFSLGRITGGNLAISSSFKSKPKDEKLEKDKQALQQDQIPMTMEEQQAQLNYIRANPAQFADFNIPWSLNLSFALNFSTTLKPDYSGYQTLVTSSINYSGDFNLTEKWKVGLNGYYDVHAAKMQSLTFSISRDMHCWQMSINATPVGYSHFFNFTISPKAGFLQDLKINRTKYFYDQ
jgi:lipopolysaccharide assembly outer membrane protein LptD (OstA)